MNSLNSELTENKKCPRIVRRHKYERLTQNNQIWWNNKFKELEANIRLPYHKKISELKKVFTPDELKSLQEAGLVYDNDEKYKIKHGYTSTKRRTFASKVYVPRRRVCVSAKKNNFVDRLIEFYMKTPEEVKVWEPKPKRNLNDTVNLIEKAAMVEEALAENFDKWFSSIESYSTSEVNKDTILKIFEVNSSLSIHKAIVVNMKFMRSVPEAVAKYLGVPELASCNAVNSQINSDIKASKIKPVNIAFGRMLPADMRKYKHIADSKIKTSSVQNALESFSAVFKDIMELETSKRFVVWLRNHPDITPPPFLKKFHMTTIRRGPKKSLIIKQMYAAKVWTVNKYSDSSLVSDNDSVSGSSNDESMIHFCV